MSRKHFVRTGHGAGTGQPHVELGKLREAPAGVPACARPVATRDPTGKFVPGDGTKAVAREGGLAAAQSRQLGQLLGLDVVPEGHPFAAYARFLREWRDDQMASLAASVGGGSVGPGPASVISTAALQLGASRFLHDQGAAQCDAKLLLEASKLGDASRQNVLAAHSLAAMEAEARAGSEPFDAAAGIRAGLVNP